MATQPKIGVRIAATGSEDVKRRMEEIRASGEVSFNRLADAGKKVGQQLEGTLSKAAKVAAALGSVTRGSSSALQATAGAVVRSADLVLGKLSSIASIAGLTGLGIAATFGGTYAGLRSVALSTGEVIEGILKLSKTSTISIDLLTRWQSAARIAGGTGNGVAAGFKSVTDKIIAAATGSADAMVPFTQLDLKIRDGAGALKNFEGITGEVIDKLVAIENPALRAKAATDLFGAGAEDIVPLLSKGQAGLKRYLDQADAFGTVIAEKDAQRVSDSLERKRRLDESLKGLKFSIAEALVPVFTKSAESVANWMQVNSKSIRRLIADVGKAVDQFQQDVANLLKGNDAAIQNSLVRGLAPYIRGVGKLLLDLGAALAGRGFGTVLPWVAHAVQALKAFKGLIEAVYTRTKGFIEDIIGGPLPTKDTIFQTLTKAFKDVRAGILGLNVPITFGTMRTLGEAVAKASESVVNFGALLVGFSPVVIAFAKQALTYVSEAFKALRQSVQEGTIRPDNYFAFINTIIPIMRDGFNELVRLVGVGLDKLGLKGLDWRDSFTKTFVYVADQIRAWYAKSGEAIEGTGTLFDTLKGKVSYLAALGDTIAHVFGLSNWKELGIVLLLAHLTGIDTIILKVIPAFTALAGLAIQVVLLFGTMVGWVFAFLTAVLGLGAGVAAAIIGIPLALIALGVGLYYFRDTTFAVFRAIGDFIQLISELFLKTLYYIFIYPFIAGFKSVFEAVEILAGGVSAGIRGAFSLLGTFFTNLWDGIVRVTSAAWEAIKAAPAAAWELTKSLWGGLYELFLTPIRKVQSLFADLWAGVKSGAAGAWNAVKGFFGFGGKDQADQGGGAPQGAMPSFDVGGYVPGSQGSPLKAIVHGGERILNLAETGMFERIMSGLSSIGGALPSIMPDAGMMPAMAALPAGLGNVSTPFDLNGRRISGFQAPPGAVRELRMALAKGATSGGGRMPRWYGGY